jgi:hypothetical protein
LAIGIRGLISEKDEVSTLEDLKPTKNYSFHIQFSNFDPQFTPFFGRFIWENQKYMLQNQAAII